MIYIKNKISIKLIYFYRFRIEARLLLLYVLKTTLFLQVYVKKLKIMFKSLHLEFFFLQCFSLLFNLEVKLSLSEFINVKD